MKPSRAMRQPTAQIAEDVHNIQRLLLDVQNTLERFPKTRRTDKAVQRMKEQLREVHARLDGVEEFIRRCQIQAFEQPSSSEEIDIWM
jgi:cob(I)alamin adenosyltransferase